MKMVGVYAACTLVFLALAVHGASASRTRQVLQDTGCPEGHFLKTFNNKCMECDKNCGEKCVDGRGCPEDKCAGGFFTSRPDDFWPFACKECTIENCNKCRGEIYDAWPVQCLECAPGYVQGKNRETCDQDVTVGGIDIVKGGADPVKPYDSGSVGGISQDTEEGSGEVVEETTPSEPENVTCPEGTFVKTKDNSCMQCDENCHDGQCVDGIGCSGCKDGYFRSAVDPFWPFTCKECTIENCEVCEDGVFDAWGQFCSKCVDGYQVLGRTQCVPVSGSTVAGVTIEKTEPEYVDEEETKPAGEPDVVVDEPAAPVEPVVVDEPTQEPAAPVEPVVVDEPTQEPAAPVEPVVVDEPTEKPTDPVKDEVVVVVVNDQSGDQVQEGTSEEEQIEKPSVTGEDVTKDDLVPTEKCPEGYFRKTFDQSCMKCDANCVEGGCQDGIGCTACKPESNTYRVRPDTFWPFTCEPCSINDCDKCVDGVFTAWPVRCESCKAGMDRYNGGTKCA